LTVLLSLFVKQNKISSSPFLSQGVPRNAVVNYTSNFTINRQWNVMYAKHGNLVDADASGAKPAQNTLNHI